MHHNPYNRNLDSKSSQGLQTSRISEEQKIISTLLKEKVNLTAELERLRQKLNCVESCGSQNTKIWDSFKDRLHLLHQAQLRFELGLLEKARASESRVSRVVAKQ